ncbi:MAG: type II toxin-antitoxin system RatA family toxin [Gammaproteobacteria bacterium]|nr:type II toxin-antitoxin system RatA family toxin [Gammaproteobacteria bacterium]
MLSKITKTITLPYSPAQMFSLVDRVEDYPLFVPWCLNSQVHSRSTEQVRASIQVGKGALGYSLTTLNRLEPDKHIAIQLVAGPFKHLEGLWQFERSPEGSKISLHLSFELNLLLRRALEPFIEKIGDRIMQAFCERAAVLYG